MYFSNDSISLTNNLSYNGNTVELNESYFATNILMIKLDEIFESEPLKKYKMKHLKECENCQLAHNHLSTLKAVNKATAVWRCKSCGHKNWANTDCVQIFKHDIEYLNDFQQSV
jgi:ribosomal protein L32